jgi:hypothetical protein
MRARISDFAAFARAVRFGIGLPFGFLRWMRLDTSKNRCVSRRFRDSLAPSKSGADHGAAAGVL